MNYADARPLIKTGDLLAWSAGGWSSWHDIQVSLVRMFTQSEFSHVGLALVLGGRVFILEAVGSGVRLFPLSRELPFYWCRRPRELGPEAVEWAFARLGDGYSKWQAIKAFLGSLRLSEDDIWECAEYALGALKADGEVLTNVATPTGVVRAAMEKWGGLELLVTGD